MSRLADRRMIASRSSRARPSRCGVHDRALDRKLEDIPFQTTDWSGVEPTQHPGEAGVATWRTRETGNVRGRMVEYSAGYIADHWCERGHVVLVLEGELVTELGDGREVVLAPGQSYCVADGDGAHRSRSPQGARLFIVD